MLLKIKVLTTYLRRRYILITPCKRSAARGWRVTPPIKNSVGVQPASGLMVSGDSFLPRATLRLHGVINVSPLRGRKRVTLYKSHFKKELFIKWIC